MTKRLKSKHKVDRRLKANIWGRPKSPFNSRAYPPGQHGQNKKGKHLKISSKLKISLLVKHLISLLESKDFFLPEEKKHSMILNINNLIYRLEPNDKELRILASIISSLNKNNTKA